MRISKSPLNLFEVFEEKLSSIIDKIRYHYDKWSKTDENGISTLDKILQKLVKMERKKTNERREPQCSS